MLRSAETKGHPDNGDVLVIGLPRPAMTGLWQYVPLLLVFLISACAAGDWSRDTGYPSGGFYWWRPGITREEFRRDGEFCRRESQRPVTDGGSEEDLHKERMQARGYQLVPKGFVPPK